MNLRSVLVSEPVDPRCEALLIKHGIAVTRKYNLSQEELINELRVSLEKFRYFSRSILNY